jgi:flagellar biosynthesis/type III secretory pathway protein FliH
MRSDAGGRVVRPDGDHAVAHRAAFVAAARPLTFSQEELDAAYTRGFLAGGEESQGDLRRALQDVGNKLDEVRRTMIEELHRIDAGRREEIVRLAFEVAQWLLQEELRNDPARVLPRIHAALPDRRDEITVRVAPMLVDVVARAQPELRVVGDPELIPGDVVINGPDAQVDGTLADALDRLARFLHTDDDGGIR